MKINFNVTGTRRKDFVKAIAEILEVQPKYLGTPTMAYQVDYFEVDRNGILEFDDRTGSKEIENLLERLAERGFCAVTSQNEEDGEVALQMQQAPQNANFGLVVEVPKECVNVDNINNLISAKGALIKKALSIENLPVEVGESIVKFPWFERELSTDEVSAFTHFISALCKMSVELKRIDCKSKPIENEKYAFRCFLLRLGFIGSEYKTERKILLKNLEGSAAFKFPKQLS
ncbi:MAG: virulence protein [Ruminococcaceae bacterium]|nr:virulence protein [Oscillospiraceae bacterium]